MIWCDTVPNPMCGSQRYAARAKQAIGVEVEVLLGVGADASRRRQQERDVGEEREPEELEAPVAFADGAASPDPPPPSWVRDATPLPVDRAARSAPGSATGRR